MLQPHVALENIEHGLDDEALAQHELVGQRHEIVAPDAGDEVQTTLPEFVEQRAADVALVSVELAAEILCDLIEHAAIGGVAAGDLQRHDLALVVDHEVQLEPIEPPHAGFAACGQAVEHAMAVDAAIVADGALACVAKETPVCSPLRLCSSTIKGTNSRGI